MWPFRKCKKNSQQVAPAVEKREKNAASSAIETWQPITVPVPHWRCWNCGILIRCDDKRPWMSSAVVQHIVNTHEWRDLDDLLSYFWIPPEASRIEAKRVLRRELGTDEPTQAETTSKYKRGWDSARRKVLRQYGRQCRQCGATGGVLHVHHIIPQCIAPELRSDPANLVILCHTCHRAAHSPGWKDRARREWNAKSVTV